LEEKKQSFFSGNPTSTKTFLYINLEEFGFWIPEWIFENGFRIVNSIAFQSLLASTHNSCFLIIFFQYITYCLSILSGPPGVGRLMDWDCIWIIYNIDIMYSYPFYPIPFLFPFTDLNSFRPSQHWLNSLCSNYIVFFYLINKLLKTLVFGNLLFGNKQAKDPTNI
jgi:hypothetical protein